MEKKLIFREEAGIIATGQFYKEEENGEIYILAQVGVNRVALIGLRHGNRFTDPKDVEDSTNISGSEWYEITAGNVFSGIDFVWEEEE